MREPKSVKEPAQNDTDDKTMKKEQIVAENDCEIDRAEIKCGNQGLHEIYVGIGEQVGQTKNSEVICQAVYVSGLGNLLATHQTAVGF